MTPPAVAVPCAEIARDASHAEFARLADGALPLAWRLAVHLLGDRAEAEDAVQEALLAAWRGWPGLRDPDRFGPWFERILANACYGRMRRRRRLPEVALPPTLEGIAPPAADASEALIARDAVGRALAALPPEQRVAVVFRYWRGLTSDEIGARLGIPAGTVRSRLHAAMRAMRGAVEGRPSDGRR